MSSTQMTVAQYRTLLSKGKNIKEQKEPDRKPAPHKRQEKSNHTPDTRRVKEINAAVRTLLARVSPLCYALGWNCDAARHFTTDPRDADYPSHRDDVATPNCVVIWRKDDTFFPFGRMKTLLWLWENLDNQQVMKRLHEVEEVKEC